MTTNTSETTTAEPVKGNEDSTGAIKLGTASSTADKSEEGEEEEEEIGLVDGFEGLYQLIERAADHVKGDKFYNKLQNRVAATVRDELRDNTYEMFKKLVFWCGKHALYFEETDEKVDEIAEEVEKQGRLLRDMATGSVLTLAAGLANAVLQKSQDVELRSIAQSVLASLGPIGMQVAQAAEAAVQAAQNGQENANIPATNAPPNTGTPQP